MVVCWCSKSLVKKKTFADYRSPLSSADRLLRLGNCKRQRSRRRQWTLLEADWLEEVCGGSWPPRRKVKKELVMSCRVGVSLCVCVPMCVRAHLPDQGFVIWNSLGSLTGEKSKVWMIRREIDKPVLPKKFKSHMTRKARPGEESSYLRSTATPGWQGFRPGASPS